MQQLTQSLQITSTPSELYELDRFICLPIIFESIRQVMCPSLIVAPSILSAILRW